MSKKKRGPPKFKPAPLIAGALIVGAVIVGGIALWQRFLPGGETALRDSETAFSVPTHVGQPAPEFTAIGVDGQLYTLTPGDSRPKAIVFYMSFQ